MCQGTQTKSRRKKTEIQREHWNSEERKWQWHRWREKRERERERRDWIILEAPNKTDITNLSTSIKPVKIIYIFCSHFVPFRSVHSRHLFRHNEWVEAPPHFEVMEYGNGGTREWTSNDWVGLSQINEEKRNFKANVFYRIWDPSN